MALALALLLAAAPAAAQLTPIPEVGQAGPVETPAQEIKRHFKAKNYGLMKEVLERELATPSPQPAVLAFAAWLHEKGRWGIEGNWRKAHELYKRAAEAGHIPSHYNAGWHYAHGAAHKDPDALLEAARWYKKGADLGHPESRTAFALILLGQDWRFLDARSELAREAVRRLTAASGGGEGFPPDPGALYLLGKLHFRGIADVLPKDPATGVKLMIEAAERGDTGALIAVVEWHKKGFPPHVPQDPARAYRYALILDSRFMSGSNDLEDYRKAAEENNSLGALQAKAEAAAVIKKHSPWWARTPLDDL